MEHYYKVSIKNTKTYTLCNPKEKLMKKDILSNE